MEAPTRRGPLIVGLILAVGLGGLAAVAGRRPPPPPPAVDAALDPHSDHRPRHGGLVLMNGDLHFEAVASPQGRLQVHFSNAVRAPLPPTTVAGVVVTVLRAGEADESIEMSIDQGCACWTGTSRALGETDTVRITYMAEEPFSVDVPFAGWVAAPPVS